MKSLMKILYQGTYKKLKFGEGTFLYNIDDVDDGICTKEVCQIFDLPHNIHTVQVIIVNRRQLEGLIGLSIYNSGFLFGHDAYFMADRAAEKLREVFKNSGLDKLYVKVTAVPL